jgi:Uma2 family endonuclease
MFGLTDTYLPGSELITQIPRRLFNVDEYYKLAEIGVLRPDEHVELLQGEIIEKFPPALRLFTADEYEKMAQAGILDEDERVELMAGRILKMSPKGLGHAVANERAYRCFSTSLGKRAIVRSQNPIRLDTGSEPEPDIVVVRPDEREYIDHHPRADEILLVLEVADSSLTYDRRTKSIFYARAGIPQFLIVNLQSLEIEDYRGPGPQGYGSQEVYRPDENVTMLAFADVSIPVAELLPPQ